MLQAYVVLGCLIRKLLQLNTFRGSGMEADEDIIILNENHTKSSNALVELILLFKNTL